MVGERARESEREAGPLSRRRIRPLMDVAQIANLGQIQSRLGGGRVDTSVRKGGEPLCRRCIRPLMFVAKMRNLSKIESIIGGGRMDTSVRKGTGATLPPLRPTANVSSKDWES